jgi:hypothetical protein
MTNWKKSDARGLLYFLYQHGQAFYTKAKTWEGLLYACQVAQGRSIPVSLPSKPSCEGKRELKKGLEYRLKEFLLYAERFYCRLH